jgi:hypothetical protein
VGGRELGEAFVVGVFGSPVVEVVSGFGLRHHLSHGDLAPC